MRRLHRLPQREGGYTEAGDRILFHGTPDGSDGSSREYRARLLMIAREEGAAEGEAIGERR